MRVHLLPVQLSLGEHMTFVFPKVKTMEPHGGRLFEEGPRIRQTGLRQ